MNATYAEGSKLKLSENQDHQKFKVKDPLTVPNRYICFIRIKIINTKQQDKLYVDAMGSGVRIADRFVLTVAHNVYQYVKKLEQIKNNKQEQTFVDRSSIRQALHDDKDLGRFRIKQVYLSKDYDQTKKNIENDFALIEIEPINPENNFPKQQKYPLVVSFSEDLRQKIKTISVYGYPIEANKLQNKYSSGESLLNHTFDYVTNPYAAKGAPKEITDIRINHTLPTEYGISGGGVFANYLKIQEFVVIGIHKGSKKKDKHNEKQQLSQQGHNFATCCKKMLVELNQIGYQVNKRPFIFTDRTIKHRQLDKQLPMENLILKNEKLEIKDILVLTAFDLSKVTRILLAYNNLGNEGVKWLLRRDYPTLRSLYLNQNKITSLDGLSEEHWKHIQNLNTLSLSSNSLTDLPQHILCLKKLKKFWLTYNEFEDIPDILIKYCQEDPQEDRVIHFYDNKFTKKPYKCDRNYKQEIIKYEERQIMIKQKHGKINSATKLHISPPPKDMQQSTLFQ